MDEIESTFTSLPRGLGIGCFRNEKQIGARRLQSSPIIIIIIEIKTSINASGVEVNQTKVYSSSAEYCGSREKMNTSTEEELDANMRRVIEEADAVLARIRSCASSNGELLNLSSSSSTIPDERSLSSGDESFARVEPPFSTVDLVISMPDEPPANLRTSNVEEVIVLDDTVLQPIEISSGEDDILHPGTTRAPRRSRVRPRVSSVPQTILVPDSPKRSPVNREEPKPELFCPVCFNTLTSKPAVSTVCGHIFCKDCITNVKKHTNKCPMCNHKLNKANSVHPIYFNN
ncbi:uncharacterized protein LOC128266853 [Anopheles cruzii]|uniref:uncharacterized protein LOC128266853 n=1 Tax=Anopheles cruzii TaxID=68878 RepID=UPI0022EC57E8|nr:uncharacterized protein LOC128266853 [Anopheles cruzii]